MTSTAMKNTRQFLTIAATMILPVLSSFGWGYDGHRIVGKIASFYLTEKAKSKVRKLIGNESLAEVSTWADEVRREDAYSWSSKLHYINFPRNSSEIDLDRDCRDGACVVGAIDRFSTELADPSLSRKERVEALKFLVHFVGDIHQPFHVSYASDRGGNRVKTDYNEEQPNLHSVWDTHLIKTRMGDGDWKALARELKNEITVINRRRWKRTLDPLKWAQECVPITRGIYGRLNWPDDGEFRELPASYYLENIEIVEGRLKIAGVRLAGLLNEVFE